MSTSEVIAAPLDGGPSRTLLGGSRSQQMADHSAVAGHVVYVTDRRGVPEVWITALAESWDRLLLSPGDIRIDGAPAIGFATPAFSPDGHRVAVVADTSSAAAIYTTPASGTMPVRVTSRANPSEYAPTWSPDGAWLAFWHIDGKKIRLAKVRSGSGETPVDLAECWNRTVPAWSPTGEWIAYHDGASQLALVSPDGKAFRKLGGNGAITWSREGKTLYQARNDTRQLVAIDIATGKEQPLRELGELVPYSSSNAGWRASLTPDGKEFVYTVNHLREEIWILSGLHVPVPWYRRWLGQ
jgi:Tol biopolymer transport system component